MRYTIASTGNGWRPLGEVQPGRDGPSERFADGVLHAVAMGDSWVATTFTLFITAIVLMAGLWFFIDSNRFPAQSGTSVTVTTTRSSGG